MERLDLKPFDVSSFVQPNPIEVGRALRTSARSARRVSQEERASVRLSDDNEKDMTEEEYRLLVLRLYALDDEIIDVDETPENN